ncbi:MAG: CPBP family intramembrane glutamic endopeptidase [Verrucomicrobiota bacterium]
MPHHISRTRILLGLGIGLLFPLISNLLYFVVAGSPLLAQIGYFGSKAMLLVWPLICFFLILPRGPGETRPGPARKQVWWSLLLGIQTGVIIFAAIVLLMQSPIGRFVLEGADAVKERVSQLGFDRNFLVAAILISTVHAALEEYYWRWFAWGQLRRFVPGFQSHVIAGFAFAAHHYVIVWVYFTPWFAIFLGTMVAVGGMIWSVMYQRTGSLIGAWISHMFVDLAIFWVGWTLIR